MSPDAVPQRGERAFAFSALLWSLGTLALSSIVLIQAGADETVSGGAWALAASAALFVVVIATGARVRFVLGRKGVSTRLRFLSGGLSIMCFVLGWSLLAMAYAGGGDAGIVTTIRRGMPTTLGLSFGVLAAASQCLFLWESIAAAAELQGAESKRNLVLATLLSLAMALVCVAALSSVVVGEMFFVGGS